MPEWYFDLKQSKAVTAEERGPAKDLLGPYPSREAAEKWRQTHEDREAAWDPDAEDGGDDDSA
jgi:hypothetical protein